MDDIRAWYASLPLVSKSYMTIVFLVTIFSSSIYMQLPEYMYISLEKIMGFQLWRYYSHFFYVGKFGPSIIWNFVFVYFSVTRLESLFTDKQVDEQIWLYIFNMTFLSKMTIKYDRLNQLQYQTLLIYQTRQILGLIFNLYFMYASLTFAFVYIWCKRKPFETVQFFFGLKFRSGYFPFILMALHVVMGDSIVTDLCGLAAGHLYIFLKDIYPVSSGKHYLKTPQFFTRFVRKYISQEIQAHNYQNPNNRNENYNNNNTGGGFRAFQGQGVRLG